jgi:alpha-D-xyloside xylohydrolase
MIDELHRENFHLMISIWPFFEPGSTNYDFMEKKGWFVDKFKFAKPPYHTDAMAVYDATNPEARKFYWEQVNKGLFSLGADAWWMDTTEPETEGQEENIQLGHKLALGSGDRFVNLYPMLDTGAVYDGQRATSDKKRVYILSRSAFAGSQRYGVTAWSGDINSDWFSYRRQIPAGLNFALSGIPYWTTDIGGFVFGSPTDPAFRELFVRWFQYGTFNPILRVHGTRKPDENELWSYGPDAQKILVSFDRLRYRLLPYTYSLAWMTTNSSYTPMRPLVMDFRSDVRAQNTWDEFMYGPAFLVNPVTEPAAVEREVYLPDAKWYDFWSGAASSGGKQITADAPLARLPIYVRAGAIVPLGPDVEWSTEKVADPIEVRVYRGADGEFTLYEDENDNYNYEKGVHATISFRWDQAQQVLTMGERQGQFPGMLASRTFRVVFVGEHHGAGNEPADSVDRVVKYDGKEVRVRADAGA